MFFCVQKVNCLQTGNSHKVPPFAPLENESWILKKNFHQMVCHSHYLSHLSSPDSGSGILMNWVSNIVWRLGRLHNQTIVLIWGSESSKFQPLRSYHMVRYVYKERTFYVVKITVRHTHINAQQTSDISPKNCRVNRATIQSGYPKSATTSSPLLRNYHK